MPRPFQVQDRYFQLAKEKGYRARSAFKLEEIQKKFRLLKRGQTVLDLGAAPGSFLQVIANEIGPQGRVIGFDLEEIETFPNKNIHTFIVDIMEKEAVLAALENEKIEKVDVVTSDLAPKTSGIRDLDQGRSAELTDQAFYLATLVLKPGGGFVGKIFDGPDVGILVRRMKRKFKKVTIFKPDSSRDRSFEIFIVAIGFQPGAK